MGKKKAGMWVDILKPASGSDCTNGGVTSKAEHALLIGEGVAEVFGEKPGEPVLKLVKRMLWGQPYYHAEPAETPKGVGWMFGGNFIHTSDGRFHDAVGHSYPIPVHDRTESPELYRRNSD